VYSPKHSPYQAILFPTVEQLKSILDESSFGCIQIATCAGMNMYPNAYNRNYDGPRNIAWQKDSSYWSIAMYRERTGGN